jgi:hypothetical protein
MWHKELSSASIDSEASGVTMLLKKETASRRAQRAWFLKPVFARDLKNKYK